MDASAVTVYPIDDIPMGNLQDVLGTIYGKAQYAANSVGWLEFHVREIAGLVAYTMGPNPHA